MAKFSERSQLIEVAGDEQLFVHEWDNHVQLENRTRGIKVSIQKSQVAELVQALNATK